MGPSTASMPWRASRSTASQLALIAVLALAASATAEDGDNPAPSCPPSSFTFPRTLLGHINWVVFVLNGGSVSEAEVADRFSPEFLAVVDFFSEAASLRANMSASWVLSGGAQALDAASGTSATHFLWSESGIFLLVISIDEGGAITYLSIQRQVEAQESFEGLVDSLAPFGNVSMLAADATEGGCAPVHELRSDEPQPFGSTFKLYILGALMDAVLEGRVAWDDPLPIRDESRSLPSGTFQLLPVGAAPSVLQHATAMIAVSDNTATDHLIDLVGRRAVEEAQGAYGHSDPGLNVPFITTREFFVLKVAFNQSQRDRYVAAGVEERRRILETEVAETECFSHESDSAKEWLAGDVRNLRDIEWFASPLDLCNALNALLQRADAHPELAPVRGILSSGVSQALINQNFWGYVGFKGGSEPGMISLAYRLEGLDGRTFNYVVNVHNVDSAVPAAVIPLALGGMDLLARKN